MGDIINIIVIISSFFVGELDVEPMTIKTVSGQIVFDVEIADEALEQVTGLMGRDNLAINQGILFIYQSDREVQFWMKNVSFPIDMIFFDHCGTIVHIHENALPRDVTKISPDQPIRAVLEIAGGASNSAQIQIGDYVLPDGGGATFSECPRQ